MGFNRVAFIWASKGSLLCRVQKGRFYIVYPVSLGSISLGGPSKLVFGAKKKKKQRALRKLRAFSKLQLYVAPLPQINPRKTVGIPKDTSGDAYRHFFVATPLGGKNGKSGEN